MAGTSRAKLSQRWSEERLSIRTGTEGKRNTRSTRGTRRTGRIISFLCLLCLLCSFPVFAQRVLMDPKFKAAEQFIDKDHDRMVREIIQITEIEAPPFKEEKRAKVFADMLRQSGLT